MPDPTPVIPLEYADAPSDRPARWYRVTRVTLVLAWLCCVIGWACIAWIDVETVIGSGPLLLALGAVLLIGGLRLRRPAFWVLGSAHCAICILFVMIVNFLSWSPGEATWPFTIMGGIYAMFATAWSAWACFETRAVATTSGGPCAGGRGNAGGPW